jgi:osmotically-inducible protein OsmY
MGKNGGGRPTDSILTLEEALMRFKRKRDEAGAQAWGEAGRESSVHHAGGSRTIERGGGEVQAAGDLKQADSASVSDERDDSNANAEMSASGDFVAVIEGIPRTFEEIERLAAAEKAYDLDFPESTLESAVAEDEDADGVDVGIVALAANRHALVRDYAFTAMGTGLMVLFAVLVMRAPIVSNHSQPTLMAQSIATPALKAATPMSSDDAITTLVVMPDSDTDTQQASALPASARPALKSSVLEAQIKDTLKVRAFTDIGVSVSKKGDAYLAGEVYSLNEARKIAHIVHNVNGVNRVHFLHPDVQPASGPAFFGVTTTTAPSVWGAKVQAVLIGSPADKAGIKPGDVISEFDGNTVPDAKYLDLLVAHYSPGQRVQFRVWRDGQPEYLVARLGETTTMASS